MAFLSSVQFEYLVLRLNFRSGKVELSLSLMEQSNSKKEKIRLHDLLIKQQHKKKERFIFTFCVMDLHLFMFVPVGSLGLDQNGAFHRH